MLDPKEFKRIISECKPPSHLNSDENMTTAWASQRERYIDLELRMFNEGLSYAYFLLQKLESIRRLSPDEAATEENNLRDFLSKHKPELLEYKFSLDEILKVYAVLRDYPELENENRISFQDEQRARREKEFLDFRGEWKIQYKQETFVLAKKIYMNLRKQSKYVVTENDRMELKRCKGVIHAMAELFEYMSNLHLAQEIGGLESWRQLENTEDTEGWNVLKAVRLRCNCDPLTDELMDIATEIRRTRQIKTDPTQRAAEKYTSNLYNELKEAYVNRCNPFPGPFGPFDKMRAFYFEGAPED